MSLRVNKPETVSNKINVLLYFVFTLADTETDTETNKNRLYRIVWRRSYGTETETVPLDSVLVHWYLCLSWNLSVSMSGNVNAPLKGPFTPSEDERENFVWCLILFAFVWCECALALSKNIVQWFVHSFSTEISLVGGRTGRIWAGRRGRYVSLTPANTYKISRSEEFHFDDSLPLIFFHTR